jgi:hypothetical protein
MSRYPTMVRINRHSGDDWYFVNKVTISPLVISPSDSSTRSDFMLYCALHDTNSAHRNTLDKVHQFTKSMISGQAPGLLPVAFH